MIITLLTIALVLSVIVNLFLWDRLISDREIIRFYKLTTCEVIDLMKAAKT